MNTLYFYASVRLQESTKIINYYDDSASTTLSLTLPAGEYYLSHPDTNKSIISLIERNFGCSLDIQSNGQIKITYPDSDDYMYFESTDYTSSFAYLLGFYHSESLTYYEDNHLTNGTTTFYGNVAHGYLSVTAGVIFNGDNVTGFTNYNLENYQNQAGVVSSLSSSSFNSNKITLTGLTSDVFNSQIPLDTSDDSTGANSAFENTFNHLLNRVYFDAGVYLVLNGDNYILYIKDTVTENSLKRVKENWNGLFSFDFEANISKYQGEIFITSLPNRKQFKFTYDVDTSSNVVSYPNTYRLRFKRTSNDYTGSHNLFVMRDTAGGYIAMLYYVSSTAELRAYFATTSGNKYWIIPSVGAKYNNYEVLDIMVRWLVDTSGTYNYLIRIDEASLGNLVDNHTSYVLTASDYQDNLLIESYYSTSYNAPAGVSEFQLWNRGLTDDEFEKVLYTGNPDFAEAGLVVDYRFNEGVGQYAYNKATKNNTKFTQGSWVNA